METDLKRRYHLFALLALLMLSACSFMVDGGLSIESEVIEHNYVHKTGGRLVEDHTRVTGLLNVGYDVLVIESDTWKIPNELGNGFYLVVKFTGIPEDINSFELKVNFPEMTLPSGEKRNAINRKIDITGHNGEYEWGFDFYFDFVYESNPGPWNIQVLNGNYKVHSSTFHVVESRKKL